MRMIIASLLVAGLIGCGQNTGNSNSSSTSSEPSGQSVRYIREGGIICVNAKSTYMAAQILNNYNDAIDMLSNMIVNGQIACIGAQDDLPIEVQNEMHAEGIIFFKRPGVGSGWTFRQFVRDGRLVNGVLRK